MHYGSRRKSKSKSCAMSQPPLQFPGLLFRLSLAGTEHGLHRTLLHCPLLLCKYGENKDIPGLIHSDYRHPRVSGLLKLMCCLWQNFNWIQLSVLLEVRYLLRSGFSLSLRLSPIYRTAQLIPSEQCRIPYNVSSLTHMLILLSWNTITWILLSGKLWKLLLM